MPSYGKTEMAEFFFTGEMEVFTGKPSFLAFIFFRGRHAVFHGKNIAFKTLVYTRRNIIFFTGEKHLFTGKI